MCFFFVLTNFLITLVSMRKLKEGEEAKWKGKERKVGSGHERYICSHCHICQPSTKLKCAFLV